MSVARYLRIIEKVSSTKQQPAPAGMCALPFKPLRTHYEKQCAGKDQDYKSQESRVQGNPGLGKYPRGYSACCEIPARQESFT